MAYGSLLADVVQSSATGTPPQFNDTTGTQVGTLCRAWVNFNGTTSPGTIRASFNVGSVTKNGTGDYTVNFTTAMPDANYASIASCSPSSGPTQRIVVMDFAGASNTIVAPTTTTCRFSTSALAATADVEYVHFAAFR